MPKKSRKINNATRLSNIINKNSEKARKIRIEDKRDRRRPYSSSKSIQAYFNYLSAPEEVKKIIRKIYNSDMHYCLLSVDSSSGKIVNARIAKTKSTFEKIINTEKRYGRDILLHPQPVKIINREFWRKYQKCKNNFERVALFKEHKILEDSNIFRIETIWIDIDSDFNQSIDVLNELIKQLQKHIKDENINITETLTIIKTKSGHLRFAFSIKPINPNVKNKNHKTNLENIKEFVKIINLFFKKDGLKADDTFQRINHPIWITKKQQIVFEAEKEINFYVLYSAVKKLQRELSLYPEKPQEHKKEKKQIKHLPSFIANKLSRANEDYVFEKRVETLYRNSLGKGRYIYFLQVLAGWCKYLNKSFSEYYDIAFKYCPDKKRDIETAWKHARPLEFKFKSESNFYNFEELADKVIEYLKQNKKAKRKDLLEKFFNKQDWLEQEIMLQLKLNGLIEEHYEKQGIGRPAKVYILVEQRKEEQKQHVLTEQENTNIREDMLANPCKSVFPHINNKLSLDNLQYGGGWKEYRESVKVLDKAFISSGISVSSQSEKDKDIQLNKINISVSPTKLASGDCICEQSQGQQEQRQHPEQQQFKDEKFYEEKKRKLLEQLSRDITEEEKQQLREKAEKEKQKKLEEEIRQKIEEIRKILERTYQKKLESLQPKKPAPAVEREPDKENQIKDEKQDLGATGKTPKNEQEKTKKDGPRKQDYEFLPSKDDYLHKPSKTATNKLKLYRKKYRAILNYDWKRLKRDEVLFFLINNEKLIAERGIKDILKTLKYADLDEKILNPVGWLIARFSISLKSSRFLYLITKKK